MIKIENTAVMGWGGCYSWYAESYELFAYFMEIDKGLDRIGKGLNAGDLKND